MGSHLGQLLTHVFMCSLEERLRDGGDTPGFYSHFVDDPFSTMPYYDTDNNFLSTLDGLLPSLNFTIEIAIVHQLPI